MKTKDITIRICLAMLSMLLAFTLSACSDEITPSVIDDDEELQGDYVPYPTDDQLEMKYSGKTAVIDNDLNKVGLAIYNRLTNITTSLEDDVDAVLLSPSVLASNFSIEKAVQLVRLYEGGATIIMIEPGNDNWQKIGQLLKKAEEQMTADSTVTYSVHRLVDRWEMMQAQSSQMVGNGNQDAVALRLNDTYFISDIQEQADSTAINAGETAQDITAYHYGKAADMLVEWLGKAEENKAKLMAGKQQLAIRSRASEVSSLSTLADAQLVTFQKSLGSTRVFGRTMPYEFKYEIYSMYNFDKDEEYYLIRQHIDYHCSNLKCGTNDKYEWTSLRDANGKAVKKTVRLDNGEDETVKKAFGPYMRKSTVRSELTNLGGGETVNLMDSKPGSSSTVAEETSGFSIGLNGRFGFGVSPTKNTDPDIDSEKARLFGISLGVQVAFTWSSSYSVSRNDLTYTQAYDNLWTQWTMEGIKPDYHYKFMGSDWHEVVGEFQRNDWGTDLTWYYRIEHPAKNRTYRLVVYDTTTVGELLDNFYNYELATRAYNRHEFSLTPPNRYKQNWLMMCSDRSLQNNLSKQLPDDWHDNFYTFALTEKGLDENMEKYFKEVRTSVAGIADILVEQGYTGSYTFYLSKLEDPDDFATFTMDNGVVSEVTLISGK